MPSLPISLGWGQLWPCVMLTSIWTHDHSLPTPLNITKGSYNGQLDHGDMSRWLTSYSFTCKPIFLLANIYLTFCFLQVPSKKSHNFSTFGAILSLIVTKSEGLEILQPIHYFMWTLPSMVNKSIPHLLTPSFSKLELSSYSLTDSLQFEDRQTQPHNTLRNTHFWSCLPTHVHQRKCLYLIHRLYTFRKHMHVPSTRVLAKTKESDHSWSSCSFSTSSILLQHELNYLSDATEDLKHS
jgi:hypothetical protein